MSINVILELQAKEESIDELKATLENILPDTRGFEGCVSVQVTTNQDDPLNLVLLEVWESRKSNEKYLGWRTETGALEALGAMLSQPPSIRYFDDFDV